MIYSFTKHTNKQLKYYAIVICKYIVIPKFIKDTTKLFGDLFEEVGEKSNSVVDQANDPMGNSNIRVLKSFDLAGNFKALDVSLADNRIVEKILKSFSEVITVVPNEIIQFDLPKPASHNTVSITNIIYLLLLLTINEKYLPFLTL